MEVYYEKAGWVRYDPTPPDLRLEHLAAMSFRDQIAAIGSTIELWWFQRVVDFDSSDQIDALKSALSAWRRLRAPSGEEGVGRGRHPFANLRFDDPEVAPALGLAVLVLAVGGWLLHRARRRRAGRTLPRSYERALSLLARSGLVRGASDTARGFASHVQAETSPEAAGAFTAITEAYLAERFGGSEPAGDLGDDVERLRTALSAVRRRRRAGVHTGPAHPPGWPGSVAP